MESAATKLVARLVEHFRVLALGGVAVIAHGLPRNTLDVDIWVEPLEDSEKWARKICPIIFDEVMAKSVLEVGSWQAITEEALAETIERDGMIRVQCLDRPLDIFRRPNEMETGHFDEVWNRATPLANGVRLPDAIDLLVTKQMTGRDKDRLDIEFLENKIEREYMATLTTVSEQEALSMLERFLVPRVAAVALSHPSPAVRVRAQIYIEELSAAGDPFAQEILTKIL